MMLAPMPAFRFSTLSVVIFSSLSLILGGGEAFVFVVPASRGACSASLQSRSCGCVGRRRRRHDSIRLYGITPRRKDPNDDSQEEDGDSTSNSGGHQGDNEDHGDDESDAEKVRRQLDILFSGNSNDSKDTNAFSIEKILQAVPNDDSNNSNNDSPVTLEEHFPPPLLTATDRDRRQTEIRLLQQLRNSEDDSVVAISLLWNLWYNERGGRARKLLEQADEYMNQPTQWAQAETVLLNLIAEHGPYFTEPLNRLATLYYLQGRHEHSYALCRIVLHYKPWHFGALSGIVMVAMARNDRIMARLWSTRRLPTTTTTNSSTSSNNTAKSSSNSADQPRRAEWVDWAVQEAQQALRQAEERTQRALGKPEEYYSTGGETRPSSSSSSSNGPRDEDDGAWQ